MNDFPHNEPKKIQFSIRSLLITTTIIAAWLGILIQPNLREMIFVSIAYLTNFSNFMLIGILLQFSSPLFLGATLLYLVLFSPRPATAWLFLGCLGLAVWAIIAYPFFSSVVIECISLTLIGISMLMAFEIYQRGLRKHIVTLVCVTILSLTYWCIAVLVTSFV
ncbi:MAG: hypothetical protein COA78_19860 [Blastopirellula sp.]|nr:MAG: hypothetical protein COA78_19860 [Blastopirellula sp.]